MVKSIEIDPRIAEFVESDKQREAIRLAVECKTIKEAASQLGVSHSSFRALLTRAQVAAALRGYAPEFGLNHPVAQPFHLTGTSTLVDAEGKTRLTWYKSNLKHERFLEVVRDTIDELKHNVKPLKPVKSANIKRYDSLLNLHVLTDAHIGALAWHEEGGDNWDVRIAEQTILAAHRHLLAHSPNAKYGFFAQLGDGLHSDGLLPVTPAHRHVLDADSRYQNVVRAAVRVFREMISAMLEKYEVVTVVMAQGNHDEAGSVWLQECFSLLYENNERVKFIVSPLPYYAHTHGKVMLGFHHGHKKKPDQLPGVFAGQFRELMGATRRTYIHCGHRHEKYLINNFDGTIVEQHPTIAARDAYAAHGGWMSGREMTCITYHADYTETGRTNFNPLMLN